MNVGRVLVLKTPPASSTTSPRASLRFMYACRVQVHRTSGSSCKQVESTSYRMFDTSGQQWAW